MDEYKKPYFLLWSGITDALEAIRSRNYGRAEERLMEAQKEAEEAWITALEETEK